MKELKRILMAYLHRDVTHRERENKLQNFVLHISRKHAKQHNNQMFEIRDDEAYYLPLSERCCRCLCCRVVMVVAR